MKSVDILSTAVSKQCGIMTVSGFSPWQTTVRDERL